MTSTRKRHAAAAIAMTLTLTAGAAPMASADPAPLAGAEAATAAASTHSPAASGPCSEVCSGHGYGTASGPATSSSVSRTSAHATGSDEWAYIGIGAGVAGLALIGAGGTFAANRRSERRTAARRSTLA